MFHDKIIIHPHSWMRNNSFLADMALNKPRFSRYHKYALDRVKKAPTKEWKARWEAVVWYCVSLRTLHAVDNYALQEATLKGLTDTYGRRPNGIPPLAVYGDWRRTKERAAGLKPTGEEA